MTIGQGRPQASLMQPQVGTSPDFVQTVTQTVWGVRVVPGQLPGCTQVQPDLQRRLGWGTMRSLLAQLARCCPLRLLPPSHVLAGHWLSQPAAAPTQPGWRGCRSVVCWARVPPGSVPFPRIGKRSGASSGGEGTAARWCMGLAFRCSPKSWSAACLVTHRTMWFACNNCL